MRREPWQSGPIRSRIVTAQLSRRSVRYNLISGAEDFTLFTTNLGGRTVSSVSHPLEESSSLRRLDTTPITRDAVRCRPSPATLHRLEAVQNAAPSSQRDETLSGSPPSISPERIKEIRNTPKVQRVALARRPAPVTHRTALSQRRCMAADAIFSTPERDWGGDAFRRPTKAREGSSIEPELPPLLDRRDELGSFRPGSA